MIFATEGLGRYSNIRAVLEAVELPRKGTLLKPNLVAGGLAATHIDAVRAVLDSLDIDLIAEGSAVDTGNLFSSLGYRDLAREYGVELVDINSTSEWGEMDFLDIQGQPVPIRISKLAQKQVVSLSLPKTHDHAVVTLSLKNLLGFVHPEDRSKVHGYVSTFSRAMRIKPLKRAASYFSRFKILKRLYSSTEIGDEKYIMGARVIHKNIAALVRQVEPELGIIDGYVGMEGAGPIGGAPVPWDMALAGDPMECDVYCTKAMGFDPKDVGYLCYLKAPSPGEIEISGEIHGKRFRPHPRYPLQLLWKEP
jgi:uncharacterized protein (DUF362 family)